jgi:hypothetical protein
LQILQGDEPMAAKRSKSTHGKSTSGPKRAGAAKPTQKVEQVSKKAAPPRRSGPGRVKSAPKRGGDRRQASPDMIDAALRQTEALMLRQAGNTFEQIAAKLGYSDRSGARNAVLAALRENVSEPNAEMKALELSRLDALHATLWPLARTGELGAVDRVLKVMERRAKILGLDAPPAKAEGDLDDQIQRELDRINGRLEESAADGQEAIPRTSAGHSETIH